MVEEKTVNHEEELADEEILTRIEKASGTERIFPIDPDFLLILGLAVVIDLTDIFLEILGMAGLGIPKGVGIAMDGFSFALIGGWIFWRTNKMVKKKREVIQALKKTIEKRAAGLRRQVTKAARSPLRRVLLRGGAALVGELIPLVGLIPFWTITVILTLREK